MGLFSKKLDFDKDNLSFEFDPSTNRYYLCKRKFNLELGDYDIIKIDIDKLNRKTKQLLEERNQDIETNKELLNFEKFQYKRTMRYKKLNAAGVQLNPLFSSYDDNKPKYYTKSVKEKFDKLLNDTDTVLAIHRVGSASDEAIKDIIINGLAMSGHASSGVLSDDYDNIENNASIFPLNEITISQLFSADAYKDSRGSILIRIPIDEYNEDIYYNYNSERRIKPKYIVGFVPVKDKSQFINQIITKDNVDKWIASKDVSKEEEKIEYDDSEIKYYFNDRKTYEKHKIK